MRLVEFVIRNLVLHVAFRLFRKLAPSICLVQMAKDVCAGQFRCLEDVKAEWSQRKRRLTVFPAPIAPPKAAKAVAKVVIPVVAPKAKASKAAAPKAKAAKAGKAGKAGKAAVTTGGVPPKAKAKAKPADSVDDIPADEEEESSSSSDSSSE